MERASREQIESVAYQLWQDRGCPWGSPDVDWFKAEQMVQQTSLRALAREIGGALGAVVSLVTEKLPRNP